MSVLAASRHRRAGLVGFLLVAAGFVSLGIPDAAPGVAWPDLRSDLDASRGGLGWWLAAAGAGYFTSSLAVGMASARRIPIPTLLIASSAIVALGLALTAAAPAWAAVIVAAFVTGLGSGGIDTGLNTYAAVRFGPREVNWLHAAYGSGAAIGPLVITGSLLASGTWRSGYAFIAILMALLGVLVLSTRARWQAVEDTDSAPVAEDRQHILRRPGTWLVLAIFFAYTGAEITLGQWSFTVLREHHGLGSGAAGLAVTGYWVSLTFGRVVLGAAVSRTGADRLLRIATGVAVIAALSFAAGPLAVSVAALLIAGFAFGPVFPTLVARTPARAGASALAVVGLQMSAGVVGASIVPAVAGLVTASAGIAWAGAVALGSAFFAFAIHETLLITEGRGDGRS